MRTPWGDQDGDVVQPSSLHWLDPVIFVTDAVARIATGVDQALKAHSNQQWEREVFLADAAYDLETIIEGLESDDA